MDTKTTLPDLIVVTKSVDDASVDRLLAAIKERLDQVASTIGLDCSPLAQVKSGHIRTLWLAKEICDEHGSNLELVNVSAGLRRVLELLDLAELFDPQYRAQKRISLTLAATESGIISAMEKTVAFLATNGVPEVTAFELQTVFYEVCTNIRRHGHMPTDKLISFDVQVSGQSALLTFIDNGLEFDPTAEFGSELDVRQAGRKLRKHGFGLAMIDRLSDSVRYHRTAQLQNVLTITKSW